MSDRSVIAWTDATWNACTGCSKVSAGCAHCYAEAFAQRQMGSWKGRAFTDVRCHDDRLAHPLHWRKPRRVFVDSISDLFHPDVPDEFIDRVFAVMALCPQHTFQILTKRPERMRAYMSNTRGAAGVICRVNAAGRAVPKGSWWRGNCTSYPWDNVWLGVSVENKRLRDARVPVLLKTRAAVKFISAEPLLEDIAEDEVFSSYFYSGFTKPPQDDRLDWVIVGGESGPKARPCDAAWIRSIVRACQSAQVACFIKQVGAHVVDRNDRLSTDCEPEDSQDWPEPECGWDDGYGGNIERDLGGRRDNYQGAPVRIRLRDRKGADPSEWPEDLRVREFPGEEVQT